MRSPILRGFGKVRQPRRFSFSPRYYNEQREDLEFRKRSIEREIEMEQDVLDGDAASASPDMRTQMRREWRRKDNRVADRKSFMRVVLIAFMLLSIVLYWLYR